MLLFVLIAVDVALPCICAKRLEISFFSLLPPRPPAEVEVVVLEVFENEENEREEAHGCDSEKESGSSRGAENHSTSVELEKLEGSE